MRKEKFDSSKEDWDNDDIAHALRHNPIEGLTKEDIDVIVAEVCGENDGVHWHWLIKRKDKKYQYVQGWCDYTGWDCQSGSSASEPFSTVKEALEAAPEVEEYGNRGIRRVLKGQVAGKIPFACYQE